MPKVAEVLYTEHIEVLGERKPRFILEDLTKRQPETKHVIQD